MRERIVSGDERRERRGRRAPRVGSTGARFPRAPDVDVDPEPLEVPRAPAEIVADEPRDPLVGRTGARFGSRSRRARRDAERIAAEDAAAPPRVTLRPPAADPEADETPTLRLPRASMSVEDTRTRVRPYVRTGGRTRTRTDRALAVETLVSIPSPRPPIEHPEHAAIDGVCDGPRSVAEVAALLEVPLGVARVLIDDMAAAGLLTVHATAARGSAPPPRDILQRVLDGLHRL
jgi:hypothetical protein